MTTNRELVLEFLALPEEQRNAEALAVCQVRAPVIPIIRVKPRIWEVRLRRLGLVLAVLAVIVLSWVLLIGAVVGIGSLISL